MNSWTQTDAKRVSRHLQNAINIVAERCQKNEEIKHAFKGRELDRHASAKAALLALYGVKGTFDRIAENGGKR